jgi:hypothetical protein
MLQSVLNACDWEKTTQDKVMLQAIMPRHAVLKFSIAFRVAGGQAA